jgi:NADH dehydrogenase/NADH:ubiquinone oxidoreductase subunit G
MVNLEINGRRVTARPGTKLLAAIRGAGFPVPTLCHHEALEPYGACRLCVVEIRRPGDAQGRIVASCLLAVEADLRVETDTADVLATRREVLDLLLARVPGSPLIRRLAAEHGLHRSSYPADENRDKCILCGLCTRICHKLGYAAIGMAGRGPKREVRTPFQAPPPDCVGCGSCARICPTENIALLDRGGSRRIWERDFPLACCKVCGRAYITEAHLARRLQATGLPAAHFGLCDECSRRELARTLHAHLVPLEKGDAR